MKIRQPGYFALAIVLLFAGAFSIYKRSLSRYLDLWYSHSKYTGHFDYWFVVAGIAMILAAIILFSMAFSKPIDAPNSAL